MSERLLFVVEESRKGTGEWSALGCGAFPVVKPARELAEKLNGSPHFDYQTTRYVPCDETGDVFAMIAAAGCQGGVFTEGGSWVCRLTNERGDSSSGYGELSPKGEPQPGARQAVLMALEKFPRGVR